MQFGDLPIGAMFYGRYFNRATAPDLYVKTSTNGDSMNAQALSGALARFDHTSEVELYERQNEEITVSPAGGDDTPGDGDVVQGIVLRGLLRGTRG